MMCPRHHSNQRVLQANPPRPGQTPRMSWWCGCVWPCLGLGLLTAAIAFAQDSSVTEKLKGFKTTNFTFPEYYEPPHHKQLRWRLKGAEATPQDNDEIQVRDAVLESYQQTGAREILITTPECRFSYTSHDAYSDGPLRVQVLEGRFTLEGKGFRWQQTNSSLVISNRVETSIRGDLLAAAPKSPSPAGLAGLGDVLIRADRFTFDGQATQAVYRGNVRVTGTNLSLACGTLHFQVPKGGGTVDQLFAEEDVRLDYTDLHARSDRAVFSASDNLVRFAGKATWQAQGREGGADDLLLDSASTTLRANGNAILKTPVTGSSFLPQQTRNVSATAATNRFVTIAAGRYEIQTNRASFTGGVLVSERTDDELQATLVCESLLATFASTNQLQKLVAEQGVVIEQGERRLSGQRAEFDAPSGQAQLTGNPEWRDGDRSGRGEVLLANLQRNQFIVRSNASLTLPHGQSDDLLGSFATPSGIPRTNAPARSGRTNTPTHVTADEYELTPETAAFRGHVQVTDPQMQLASDTLTIRLSPGGTNVVSVTANQNVVMSLVETNGVTTTTCTQAVYTAATEILDLTGQPTVNRPDGSSFTTERVSLNRATGDVEVRGSYSGTLKSPPGTATNTPALPTSLDFDLRKKRPKKP